MSPAIALVSPPTLGLALAVASIVLPAAPFGPLFASPPIPFAMLWLAFGWAAAGGGGFARPALLFAAGLAHDQISGGPLGVMAVFYLSAYLASGVAAALTRSFSWLTEWAGFAGAAAVAALSAAAAAVWALRGGFALQPFAIAVMITVALFPLARVLYVERAAPAPGGPP